MSTSKANGPRSLEQLDAAVSRLSRDVVGLRGESAEARNAAADAAAEAAGARRAAKELADTVREAVKNAAAAGAEGGDQDGHDQDDGKRRPPSWWHVTDPATADTMLRELRAWLDLVYLKWKPAAASLASCWAWHPQVVAELWALRESWYAAHEGPRANPGARMDWYDRWRPGVEKRLRIELQGCSMEQHQLNRPGTSASRGKRAGGVEALSSLAAWWASTHGDQDAPVPTPDMLATEQGNRPITY